MKLLINGTLFYIRGDILRRASVLRVITAVGQVAQLIIHVINQEQD